MSETRVVETAAWQSLQAHHRDAGHVHLRELFARDPGRAERFTLEAAGLWADLSKQRVTAETLRLLLALAEERGLRGRIDAMFSGQKLNVTEGRAVLHVALRAPRGQRILVDGQDVVPGVHEVLDRMADFSRRVRSGEWKGHTGQRLTTIVNIGIGGSDLGPVMAYEALRHYATRELACRFVSNVDGTDLAEATRDLDPARHALHRRLQDLHHPGDDGERLVGPRLAAVEPEGPGGGGAALRGRVHQRGGGARLRHRPGQHVRLLGLGGRSLLAGLGHRPVHHAGHRAGGVRASMLGGFHAMDEHFRTAPFEQNLPVLHGAGGRVEHQLPRRRHAWRCCRTTST